MSMAELSEGRPRPAKRHGGRPTEAEARRRQEHLLEVAGAMFMRFGYDGTSIEAVAEAAGMSKRTVYARYADKHALFSAVIRQLIERWLVPIARIRCDKRSLRASLVDIGRHLLTSALTPAAVGVRRVIIGEAGREPGFARMAHLEGWQPAVRAIAEILGRHRGELRLTDLERAAAQFMSLVVDNSLRLATLGTKSDKRTIDAAVRAAVDLFLNGALHR
jgi:AcrR family transcriptional regulator